ncbi:FAD/NAD(P)-binding protein [Falsirhodobacter xinxiangensis]|uniref:FAD/NAD(P)-binding protein n=1 Tax=Falsirhodobacter xinxiangensis TaxID=2530049 RepID=UPI0010AAABFF|nr:FAD/NAD(P)-binding protein [Rhodobacter xinxiangensis]
MKDLPSPASHILVIGGGASGVLMAAHLLLQGGTRVTLVEKGDLLGCGIAYSTTDPDHILNTRVHNMSAFPDRPHHFHDWLIARGTDPGPNGFVSRSTYGDYMSDLLAPWQDDDRLVIRRGEITSLDLEGAGVSATLASGEAIRADRAILATGHAVPDPQPDLDSAWSFDGDVDRDGRVLIVGSGLSMIDQTLSLLKAGHRGEIVSLSRHGLLPLAHGHALPRPRPVDPPLGAEVSALLHWARGLAREAEANGGSWRDAIDSIRPHAHSLWRAMSTDHRRRFMRHAASWWGVHRHRIPPASWETVLDALTRRQLVIRRGTFSHVTRENGTRIAHMRLADGTQETLPAARIIDCRGILRDLESHGSPLIRGLLAQGVARMDPLRIGLDVGLDCRLIDANGNPVDRILALGPVSRAAFWEITAIPDIREQAARLAAIPAHQ